MCGGVEFKAYKLKNKRVHLTQCITGELKKKMVNC